ncbi:MAG: DUF4326 domain-containing protein [Anaeroplasmataceae bacterium]
MFNRVRIINLKTYKPFTEETLVKVDRTSVLGNPFYLKTEADRSSVIFKYNNYIIDKIKCCDEKIITELNRILLLCKKGDVALGCWCTPKECHSDILLKLLEWHIANESYF